MQPRTAYTGRPRERKTRRSVRIAETVARLLITVGGVGTILAVVTVFAFLLYVVYPLFQSASVLHEDRAQGWRTETPIRIGIDEDQTLVWGLFADGRLEVVELATGKVIAQKKVFEGPPLSAWAFDPGTDTAIFGFHDGSLRTGAIRFLSRRVDLADAPPAAKELKVGAAMASESGLLTRSGPDQFRLAEVAVELNPPVKGSGSSPVLFVDQTTTTNGAVVAVLTADGKLRLETLRKQENMLTRKTVIKRSGIDLPHLDSRPLALFVSSVGDQVYVFGKDGRMTRIDARDREAPKIAETRSVVKEGATLTIVRPMLGKETFLVGDSSGHVGAWFSANPSEDGGGDVSGFVRGHDFSWGLEPVTSLAVSDRTRMAAAGFADGKVRLFYVTSERTMLDLDAADKAPVRALAIAPKDDGLVALGDGIRAWAIDPKHPEVTLQTVFGKVWYEGYPEPQYMWQSSGGSEPRFSLMPLIIGTLKASFYSLLFGVPIALAAAVYTAEFMNPRAKSYLKPAIESMASLPSVVLGFLAGLVFAPYIETIVPAVLASILTVPLAFLGGAYLWQLVPERITLRLDRWKFLFICLAVPIGLAAAVPVGSLMETVLYGGDLRSWIDGRSGSGVGGWMFLLLPIGGFFVSSMMSRFGNPILRVRAASLSRSGAALLDAFRFCVGFALTLFLVWLVALLFEGRGMDPRGSFMLGPYSQRNVLIVGFAMGFAIIPIVYTIAEDALSAVPEHLRAGSLAAGATRWQTATRIVIPTAMSGLFSAVMIGTGRAVGETMIVLMATGNTPVMDWSLFTGARTLSASIAVQLPEEVRNSTAYRTLFLAALSLFAMTFVLNTLAEAVRLRFRKRSYQL